jgi:hypothetical protein
MPFILKEISRMFEILRMKRAKVPPRIGAFILAVLMVATVLVGCTSAGTAIPLSATVRDQGDGVLSIANNDPFYWTNITISITVTDSPAVFVHHDQMLGSGGTALYGLYTGFLDSAGQGLDYAKHRLKELTIDAELPQGKKGRYEITFDEENPGS